MLNGGRLRSGLLVVSMGGLLVSSLRCGNATSGAQPTSNAGASNGAGTAGAGLAGGSAGSTVAASGSGGATNGVAGGGLAGGGASGGGASGAGGAVGAAGSAGAGGAGGSSGAAGSGGSGGSAGAPPVTLNNYDGPVFYVTSNDGSFYAYQEGTLAPLGHWTGLPITDAARGIDADPVKGIVYISHGGAGPDSNGSATKTGSLLAWSLYQNKVVYDVK